MAEYQSLGGKYAGILTKKLKNGDTAFYITYRDIESKVRRKKVGIAPDMTKRKASDCLSDILKEIEAKKELSENPNSPIPKILRKKIDKQVYTLNDLADYYFHENNSKSKREMQNKYNYHFSDEPLATKNIHLISEDDLEDFIKRKSKQRADSRRSNSTNVTKLHEQGFLPKRKRKSKALKHEYYLMEEHVIMEQKEHLELLDLQEERLMLLNMIQKQEMFVLGWKVMTIHEKSIEFIQKWLMEFKSTYHIIHQRKLI